MSERRHKRRTQSAADVEFVTQYSESSPLTQKTRRKSSARQARLVGFPMQQPFYSGMPLQTQAPMTMSQPVFNAMTFQQSQVVYPQPQIINNSIVFTLLPQQNEIPYSVPIDKQNYPKATLKASGGISSITFSLNNTLFSNAALPIDISSLIVNGNNFFQFCTFGFQTTIFVEISLESYQDPQVLVDRVVNQFPAPPPIVSDPFATYICPITQKSIEKPARGVNCTHSQCFDLKAYILRSLETNTWECPICGCSLPYEDLRYDRDYLKQPPLFGLSDESDGNNMFSDIVDRRFDPFDTTNLFMDRDF